jgi:hypothetical protein
MFVEGQGEALRGWRCEEADNQINSAITSTVSGIYLVLSLILELRHSSDAEKGVEWR